jgi:hypothetical protein
VGVVEPHLETVTTTSAYHAFQQSSYPRAPQHCLPYASNSAVQHHITIASLKVPCNPPGWQGSWRRGYAIQCSAVSYNKIITHMQLATTEHSLVGAEQEHIQPV